MSSVQMEGGDAIPWQEEHTYNTRVPAQRGLQYFVCVSVCLFSHSAYLHTVKASEVVKDSES